MKATLTRTEQDMAYLSVVLNMADVKNPSTDTKPSQESIERIIRIGCREELEQQSIEAVGQFEIECGTFSGGEMTASVRVPCLNMGDIGGYKGVEVRRSFGGDARERMLDAAVEAAIANTEFRIPQSLVDNESDRLAEEYQHQLYYQAMAAGSATFFLQKEVEDHMDELRRQAVRNVKAELLLKAVIHKERLEVTKDELETEAKRIAQEQQIPFEMVKDFFGTDLGMLEKDLLIRKAQEFILEYAVIV